MSDCHCEVCVDQLSERVQEKVFYKSKYLLEDIDDKLNGHLERIEKLENLMPDVLQNFEKRIMKLEDQNENIKKVIEFNDQEHEKIKQELHDDFSLLSERIYDLEKKDLYWHKEITKLEEQVKDQTDLLTKHNPEDNNFNHINDLQKLFKKYVEESSQRILSLEEQVKALQDTLNAHEKFRIFHEQNLNASIRNFNKFVEKFSLQESKPAESESLCPICEGRKTHTHIVTNKAGEKAFVESTCIGCKGKGFTNEKDRENFLNKKTKTYWVNVYWNMNFGNGKERILFGDAYETKRETEENENLLHPGFIKTICFDLECDDASS